MTTDMSPVIIPRSDQLSADDFIAGPRTFTIERVEIRPGTEQPVSVYFSGEERPWKSCKSMNRVLVAAWGPDAKAYVGRAVTLYRDPKVKWGGMEVGGIRISHMSHLERDMMIQLTATKGKRAPHVVKAMVAEVTQHPAADGARKWADAYINAVNECQDADALNALANSKATKLAELAGKRPELHTECVHALDNRRAALTFEPEGKPETEMGEGYTDTAEEWEA